MTAHIIHVDFPAIGRHRSRSVSIDPRGSDAGEFCALTGKLEAIPFKKRLQAMRKQGVTRAPDDDAEPS